LAVIWAKFGAFFSQNVWSHWSIAGVLLAGCFAAFFVTVKWSQRMREREKKLLNKREKLVSGFANLLLRGSGK
jgi:hypothetical protein